MNVYYLPAGQAGKALFYRKVFITQKKAKTGTANGIHI